MLLSLKIKQNWDIKHCYDVFVVARGVPEKLGLDSQSHGGRCDILEGNILATMLDLVAQGPRRSIRSLKIIAKENMKVL